MKKYFLTRVLSLTALIGFAWFIFTVNATQQKTFWIEAEQGGMAEVALGNLALEKSQNERVKQFAQQMVTEHTAVNQELMSLAASKSVTLPADVNAKQKSTYDKLSGMTADSFDREYIKIQVKDHEAMVKLFDKQSKNMTDADAHAFAAGHLPALQRHLSMARSLSTNTRTMNGSNGMSSGNNSNSRMQGNMDMNINGGQNSNANRNMSNGNV